MDILALLLKRTKYNIGTLEIDKWLEIISNSDEKDIFIVLTENALNKFRMNGTNGTDFFNKYNLKAMFDLKNPYINTKVNFFLYVFTKDDCNSILYGIYKNEIITKQKKITDFALKEEFPESYFSYIENIEKYLETEICPNDTENQEFGIISRNIREKNCWNPNSYSKSVLKIKTALKKEKTVSLETLATIMRPVINLDGKIGKKCFLSNWTYPLDYSKLKDGFLTDSVLQKGDIVFLDKQHMFLVYEEPKTELHTSQYCFIIRPIKISSEYLYLYLQSETSKTILESESTGSVIKRMSKEKLSNFPIILPTKNDEYYQKIFYANNFLIKDIEEINRLFCRKNVSSFDKKIENILELELLNNLKICKENIKEKILEEDFNEINTCFKHKAYKAAIILTGSVLEAILIDWLSELHGKNYFEEEYIDRYGNKGTLAIYIRDIKYLKRPKWISEAEKAYAIKEKRNQVHAKLCLKSENITEDLCREIIGYLKDVIKTRNEKESYRTYDKIKR